MKLNRRLFQVAQPSRGLLRDHQAKVDTVFSNRPGEFIGRAKRNLLKAVGRRKALGQFRRVRSPEHDVLEHLGPGFLLLLHHEPDQQVQQQRHGHDRQDNHQQQRLAIPQDVPHLLEKNDPESCLHCVSSVFGRISFRNALSKNDSPVSERIASTPPSKQSLPS